LVDESAEDVVRVALAYSDDDVEVAIFVEDAAVSISS
jgi:hypothetical protein